MNPKTVLSLWILFGLYLAGCGQIPTQTLSPTVPAVTPTELPRSTDTATATVKPSVTSTSQPTETPTITPSETVTPLPSETATITPTPTRENLRGEVIVEHASCRYGPGAAYLYKYGLLKGNILEIFARNVTGTWVEIHAIGGTNPCWVSASLMKINGDVMTVYPIQPEDIRLPMSPYYGPVTSASASRAGNEVTVSWSPITLRAGDDSEQYPYLVEAWVCQEGQAVFKPIGTYETTLKIVDEPGCATPSHARLYGVEKHGYTRWIEIPWP